MRACGDAQPTVQARWATAIAGAAVAIGPLSAEAIVVGDADLDRSVALGETYQLPGLSDFKFTLNAGATSAKLQTAVPGARLAMNYLVTPFDCSWGDHPTNEHTINCNPGYVSAGVFNGPVPYDSFEGGMTYSGGGTFSGTPEDHGYLGFLVERDDGKHYGWVEVTVRTAGSGYESVDGPAYSLIVNGYGYETEAGVGIVTGVSPIPEPSALAMAAVGFVGVAAAVNRRRRKPAAAVA